jgi:hypothetical protein
MTKQECIEQAIIEEAAASAAWAEYTKLADAFHATLAAGRKARRDVRAAVFAANANRAASAARQWRRLAETI